MENIYEETYIKVLDQEHGKKVIQFYKSRGFENIYKYEGRAKFYSTIKGRIIASATIPKNSTETFIPETFLSTKINLTNLFESIKTCK